MSFISLETVAILLFFIGFYGLVSRKNILHSIVAISVMEAAAVVLLLNAGFVENGVPPIGSVMDNAVDPLPQALVITAIIIGVAVTAINLTMFISLCRQYGTADWHTAMKKRLE